MKSAQFRRPEPRTCGLTRGVDGGVRRRCVGIAVIDARSSTAHAFKHEIGFAHAVFRFDVTRCRQERREADYRRAPTRSAGCMAPPYTLKMAPQTRRVSRLPMHRVTTQLSGSHPTLASTPRRRVAAAFANVERPPAFVRTTISFSVSTKNSGDRSAQRLRRRDLGTDFVVVAARRFECGVESRAPVGSVRELVQRRRFESAAVRRVDAARLRRPIHDANGRIDRVVARASRVIAVGQEIDRRREIPPEMHARPRATSIAGPMPDST